MKRWKRFRIRRSLRKRKSKRTKRNLKVPSKAKKRRSRR